MWVLDAAREYGALILNSLICDEWCAVGLHEHYIRFAAFIVAFGATALWEKAAPLRQRSFPRIRRWPSNLALVGLNLALVKVLLSVAAVGWALRVQMFGWGLLNNVSLPHWMAVAVSMVVLDLAIYLQHRLFHAVPALWWVHRVHHADLDMDVTTGARFHPVEFVLSMLIKFGVIAVTGTASLGVLFFEALLNATSMFHHANARMPKGVDRVMRWFLVTPDMHRVHHSIVMSEANSNFGFILPLWDRLLGTYCAQPAAGHECMTIGIEQFRDPHELRLDRMLTQPFREEAGGHEIGSEAASA